MKIRSIALTLATICIGLAVCAAQNPNMGMWKLNEAKSKLGAGLPKNLSVMYEADGDNMKATVEGVDAKGNATHSQWTGKFDGTDYPVTGDSMSDMRSLKQVNERTLEMISKKDGKVVMQGKIVVAPDGKSRTLTVAGHDSSGKKVKSVMVYDKQ